MTKKITVLQALKQSGIFKDEKEINETIKKNKVTLDGEIITKLNFQFNPRRRKLLADGKETFTQEKYYFILNKQKGYSCQKNEKFPFVVDLIKVDNNVKNSLFSVGRLDVPTTGLLIITNDGKFARKILAPESKVPKTYEVVLEEEISNESIKKLESGILLRIKGKNYKTLPAKLKQINSKKVEITICEGKKRQVREMFKEIGNKVLELKRIKIGNLSLAELKLGEGEYKQISNSSIIFNIENK